MTDAVPRTADPVRDVALTLAGGGNRAFYQLGLVGAWWERLAPRLGMLTGCSAGACVAILLLTGRGRESFAYWHRRRGHVTRNLQWEKLLRGERPAPHAGVYRDTLRFALADGGFARVVAQPYPVLVLTAIPPHGLPVPLAVPIGLGGYSLERWLHPGKLHPAIGRRLGFEPLVSDLREAPSAEAMVDLIVASSATPPFTPVGSVGGRAVLDGGLVDNAPAFVADERGPWRRHMVVLTRPYPPGVMGHRGGRWYLCPSEAPPADRWDYTRPERVEQTVALGSRDAAGREAEFAAWLGHGGTERGA